jgi:hypothetical protein
LAGFDIGTLPELALLYDAIDLRPDLRDAVDTRATRQLGGQLDLLRLNGNRNHLRDRRRRGLLLLAAARQNKARQSHQSYKTFTVVHGCLSIASEKLLTSVMRILSFQAIR